MGALWQKGGYQAGNRGQGSGKKSLGGGGLLKGGNPDFKNVFEVKTYTFSPFHIRNCLLNSK